MNWAVWMTLIVFGLSCPSVFSRRIRVRLPSVNTNYARPAVVPIPVIPRTNYGYGSHNSLYPSYGYGSGSMNDNWSSAQYLTRLLDMDRKSAVTDVAIVCDKDFSAIFNHNRTKILEYWSLRFYEINMHFMSLPSTNITFRVTSLTLMKSTFEQPFIEKARDSTTGNITMSDVLPLFSEWVYNNQYKFPSFHLAMAVTNASRSESGGAAYVSSVCSTSILQKKFWGTLVVSDTWPTQEMNGVAHELGHAFGAEHDDGVACSTPFIWQKPLGHIMMSRDEDISKPTFSQCSNRNISKFIQSGDAFCVPRQESSALPILDPDYDDVLPPSLTEQCVTKQGDPEAFVLYQPNAGKCRNLTCWVELENGTFRGVTLTPNENTNCQDGKRCFFGECVEPGSLLINVGSGKCLRSLNRFSYRDTPTLTPCPRSSNGFDRFIVTLGAGNDTTSEMFLATRHLNADPFQNDQKCLRAIDSVLQFDRCNTTNNTPQAGREWELLPFIGDEYLLLHTKTGKCLRQVNSIILLDPACNKMDNSFRWKFNLVYPTVGMCGDWDTTEDYCTSDLKLEAEFRQNVSEEGYEVQNPPSKPLILDISLGNAGEAAIAPAIEVSWAMKLSLKSTPQNCFQFPQKSGDNKRYRCKLGRLLKENETASVVSLQFDMSPYTSSSSYYLADSLVFRLSAHTASRMLKNVEIETKPVAVRVLKSKVAPAPPPDYNIHNTSDEDEFSSSEDKITFVVIVVIASVVVLVGVAIALFYFCMWRRKSPQDQSKSELERTDDGADRSMIATATSEIEVETEKLTASERVLAFFDRVLLCGKKPTQREPQNQNERRPRRGIAELEIFNVGNQNATSRKSDNGKKIFWAVFIAVILAVKILVLIVKLSN